MTHHRHTKVEIDLDALKHNAGVAQQKSGPAQVMSAIKANAYGHGMLQTAAALKGIVDEFAVASIDDVLEIRQKLPSCIDVPITVLSGFYRHQEIAIANNNNASLVVYDDHQIELLINGSDNSSERQKILSNTPLSIWLKIDTGMSRLGLQLDNLEASIEKLEVLPNVVIRGILSHFANADDIQHHLNKQQLKTFQQVHKKFKHKHWHWSIANSAALLSSQELIEQNTGSSSFNVAYDWVRPGIMLYGSSPFVEVSAQELGLKPVMTFTSEVISIRHVKQAQTVGYGSTWKADKDTTVAVVSCGYGDGYPRVISENTSVLVDGQKAIILGRVSMDLMVVDVSGIDVRIGSKVVLWGKGLSVDEIAQSAGTIGYELLCGVTGRVERQYSHSGS